MNAKKEKLGIVIQDEFLGKLVRILVDKDGTRRYVATDVCQAMEYKNPDSAVENLTRRIKFENDEAFKTYVPRVDANQTDLVWTFTTSGMLKVCNYSRQNKTINAKKFLLEYIGSRIELTNRQSYCECAKEFGEDIKIDDIPMEVFRMKNRMSAQNEADVAQIHRDNVLLVETNKAQLYALGRKVTETDKKVTNLAVVVDEMKDDMKNLTDLITQSMPVNRDDLSLLKDICDEAVSLCIKHKKDMTRREAYSLVYGILKKDLGIKRLDQIKVTDIKKAIAKATDTKDNYVRILKPKKELKVVK